MRFRVSRWQAFLGLLTLLVGFSAAGSTVWWFWDELLPRSFGARALILWFGAFAVAGFFVLVELGGALLFWHGGRTFVIDSSGVTQENWIGRNEVRWKDVVDWGLPPTAFAGAPTALELVGRDGTRVTVPLELKPAEELRRRLAEHFAPLREHGFDEVRHVRVKETPSVWHVRLERDGDALMGGLGGAFALLIFGSIGWWIASGVIDHHRLNARHAVAEGEVLRIDGGVKRTHAVVRFRPHNAAEDVRVRRQVKLRFEEQFKAGDPVYVEYLPERPTVARIRDWDVAGRRWVLLVFVVPFAWLGLYSLQVGVAAWWRPVHEVVWWSARERGNRYSFDALGAALETLYAAFSERHRGAIVFARVTDPLNKGQSDLPVFASRLKSAGLAAREVAGMFVVLGGEDVRKFVGRLGRVETWRADYVVLESENADDAEAYAVNRLAREGRLAHTDELEGCRFFSWHGAVGPFGREEIRDAFDRWTGLRLRELFGHAPPKELMNAGLADVLEIDPSEGGYQIMIERFGWGVRVWSRRDLGTEARVAEFHHGRWMPPAARPVPRAMRGGRLKAILFFLGPLFVVLIVVVGVVWLAKLPFERWSRERAARRRRGRLEAAREAVGRREKEDGRAGV